MKHFVKRQHKFILNISSNFKIQSVLWNYISCMKEEQKLIHQLIFNAYIIEVIAAYITLVSSISAISRRPLTWAWELQCMWRKTHKPQYIAHQIK